MDFFWIVRFGPGKKKDFSCVNPTGGEVQLYNVDFERQKIIFGQKNFGCELEQFVQVTYNQIQVV